MMQKEILKTTQEVIDFLKDFKPSYALDTETTGLKYMTLEIEGLSLCDGNKACYIPFMYRRNINSKIPETYWVNPEHDSILLTLKTMFGNSNTIIGHNLVFDMKVIYKYGISLELFNGEYKNRKIYDTMIADHLIDENRLHGLKYLSEHILGHETKDYKDLNDSGSDVFAQYAINDAVWTYELCMYQQPILKTEGLVPLFRNIEMPFQFVLFDMEINGMLIDVDKVKDLEKELSVAVQSFNEELHNILGEKCAYQADLNGNINCIPTLNFNSGKVLQDILFNKLGLKVIDTTPGGAPSTGKETLAAYKKTVPFVILLNKYKIATKLLTTYFSQEGQIMRNLDSDNKVRPNIRDTGTKTGRLSMSNPNNQQLPKSNEDFPINSRSVYIVAPGRKMIVSDFGSQEICVAAEISQDPTLISALKNGHDVHLSVANSTFNLEIPTDCLSKKHPQYNYYKKKYKKQRSDAKAVTFGTLYGKGTYGFAKDFDIDEIEAQKLIDKFFLGMPKVKDAIDSTQQEIKNNGNVTYMSGRKRHFTKEKLTNFTTQEEYLGYSKRAMRQGFNASIQGFSADMMRMAMIDIRNKVKFYPDYDIRIISTIHDEIIVTCKEEYEKQSADLITECMVNSVKFVVPITADTDIVKNYGDAK